MAKSKPKRVQSKRSARKTNPNYVPQPHVNPNLHWVITPTLKVGNRTVEKDEVIKISQVWGTKFKFVRHVYNPKTETEWIDCVELHRGIHGQSRSFRPDRVKVLPKKRRPRKKKTDLG